MGNGNVNNDMDPNNVDINDWVIVNSPAGRFLGKPSSVHVKDVTDGSVRSIEKTFSDSTSMKELVIECIATNGVLELSPVLDFMAPLRPVQTPQGMQMTRDPIVVPVDFTVQALPVFVKVTAVYFLGDMQEIDKKTYKELVVAGLATALKIRAASSGLELAGGPLPPGKVNRG